MSSEFDPISVRVVSATRKKNSAALNSSSPDDWEFVVELVGNTDGFESKRWLVIQQAGIDVAAFERAYKSGETFTIERRELNTPTR